MFKHLLPENNNVSSLASCKKTGIMVCALAALNCVSLNQLVHFSHPRGSFQMSTPNREALRPLNLFKQCLE